MEANNKVVLFDAVCKLCSGWARFLIRHDVQRKYKLASVQSPQGQAILASCGLPTQSFDTLVLVDGEKSYFRSSAVIRILAGLPLPWKLIAIVWIIPRPLRDWLYDKIARNRYKLFGKYETCMLPAPDHKDRFLDE